MGDGTGIPADVWVTYTAICTLISGRDCKNGAAIVSRRMHVYIDELLSQLQIKPRIPIYIEILNAFPSLGCLARAKDLVVLKRRSPVRAHLVSCD